MSLLNIGLAVFILIFAITLAFFITDDTITLIINYKFPFKIYIKIEKRDKPDENAVSTRKIPPEDT